MGPCGFELGWNGLGFGLARGLGSKGLGKVLDSINVLQVEKEPKF